MKKITLGYRLDGKNREVYYVNVVDVNSGKKIGLAFNKYDLMAYADSLNLLAETEDKLCFALNRQKKQNLNQNS